MSKVSILENPMEVKFHKFKEEHKHCDFIARQVKNDTFEVIAYANEIENNTTLWDMYINCYKDDYLYIKGDLA